MAKKALKKPRKKRAKKTPTKPHPDIEPSPGTFNALTSKDLYFDQHSHFGTHEEILKDEVRTKTFIRAIVDNSHIFKNKIVLDVGCGLGFLSMLAAKAGAQHVYGIDCSALVVQGRIICKANGFKDRITLIQGKVEDVVLPVDKVDIIISDWMGYFLLHESKVESVLMARDRWLAPTGILLPDKASMLICAIEDLEYRADKIEWWNEVYKFNMSCMKELVIREPFVDTCDPAQVISDSCVVFKVDLATVTKEELDFSGKFRLRFSRQDTCHALVAYFRVEFSHTHTNLSFSTGPLDEYTYYKQTLFFLDHPFKSVPGEPLTGIIQVKKDAKDLDILLSCETNGYEHCRKYRLH